ncbi:MAG: GGDEF domain-containing protein [Actinobacteria bacterium]|nr:GGDEF domain-containing protein [Actinomycetota bacterium]MCG2802542.1 GGDEF domain-containing protein [Cellulomonas sp.]
MRRPDELAVLARRVVALGIAVCVPVLVGIWFTDARSDPWVRWGYPPLLVFLAAFAWVLLQRSRWAVRAALVTLVGLELWWVLVAVGRIAQAPDAASAWASLAPTPMLDVAVCLVVGFLFQAPRTAALHGGAYALVATVAIGAALLRKPGAGDALWLTVRYGVYLGVFIALLLVLSRAKERVAAAVADAAAADATASRMREMAYRDELTGLANRRRLLEELRFQAGRVGPDHPVSVVYLDLDHFKAVNDSLGHAVGDRVLQVVAEVATEVVGPGDLLARLGGEEFVVVAPGIDGRRAALLAEQLRERLPDAIEAVVGRRVTASYGVAELTPGQDPAGALQQVDALMYRAKAAGRDRVAAAEG